MNNKENQAARAVILWIIRLILIIKLGMFSWNWVEPESFFGAIKFLLTWGVCVLVAELVLTAIYFSLIKK